MSGARGEADVPLFEYHLPGGWVVLAGAMAPGAAEDVPGWTVAWPCRLADLEAYCAPFYHPLSAGVALEGILRPLQLLSLPGQFLVTFGELRLDLASS